MQIRKIPNYVKCNFLVYLKNNRRQRQLQPPFLVYIAYFINGEMHLMEDTIAFLYSSDEPLSKGTFHSVISIGK